MLGPKMRGLFSGNCVTDDDEAFRDPEQQVGMVGQPKAVF